MTGPVDVLVFLQCTSPFVAASDLDAAVGLVLGGRPIGVRRRRQP